MLTDIFAERYADVPVWHTYGDAERRLLVQAFRIVSEQLFPYWTSEGKERDGAKAQWKSMHDRLSMELGLDQLAPLYYQQTSDYMGKPHTSWVPWALEYVCKAFVCSNYDPQVPADRFMKERLSFIEIAFRDRNVALAAQNEELPRKVAQAEVVERLLPANRGARIPGSRADSLRAANALANQSFKASVDELNERFRRAGTRLNYHNGFIQVADDALVEKQVETPFWDLVSDLKWKNVDTDMKEAIDRRDGGQRDPAFYAARALESTIKIISSEKGWTHGGERGAHAYIDNLAAAKNGGFIERWESEALKAIFSHVRNELGHGPGGEPMPELTPQQTNWAIESCMVWIKNLIQRM
jgi:hypothetical protein